MSKKLSPIHPGEILMEEFLKPMNAVPYNLLFLAFFAETHCRTNLET